MMPLPLVNRISLLQLIQITSDTTTKCRYDFNSKYRRISIIYVFTGWHKHLLRHNSKCLDRFCHGQLHWLIQPKKWILRGIIATLYLMDMMEIFEWRISWCQQMKQQQNEIITIPTETLQRKPEIVQMKTWKSNCAVQSLQLLTLQVLYPIKIWQGVTCLTLLDIWFRKYYKIRNSACRFKVKNDILKSHIL